MAEAIGKAIAGALAAKAASKVLERGKVIEWPTYEGKEEDIVWKYPYENVNWGDVLYVNEYEVAAFYRDGKLYNVFSAGRHTLTTLNLPLISKTYKILYKETPFRSTVIFASTKEFVGKFGGRSQTKELFPIIVNGQYWYKMKDPTLFLNEVVGGNKNFTTGQVNEFLRGFVNQKVMKELSVYDMGTIFTEGLDITSAKTKVGIEKKFEQFGLELYDLKFNHLDTTNEYRDYAVMMRSGVSPEEVLRLWTIKQSAKELGKSSGAGVGAGLILPQMTAQTPTQKEEDPMTILKRRFAKGEITEKEYEEMKKVLSS